MGASLTLQSDFRYRGRSISDEKPALTLNLSYDHASGAYVGGEVTAAATSHDDANVLRRVAYAGYAARRGAGPVFDVGIANYHVADFSRGKRTFDYTEVYAGLLGDRFSLRAHYAPDYYESRVKTLYVDVSGAIRARPDLRVFAHAGLLTRVGGADFRGAWNNRHDVSIGIARRLRDLDISATWLLYDAAINASRTRKKDRTALVVGAAYLF